MFGPYSLIVTAEVAGLEVDIRIVDHENARIVRHGLEWRLAPPEKSERLLHVGRATSLKFLPGKASREAACIFANTDQWN